MGIADGVQIWRHLSLEIGHSDNADELRSEGAGKALKEYLESFGWQQVELQFDYACGP
jgi:hypothetical protein